MASEEKLGNRMGTIVRGSCPQQVGPPSPRGPDLLEQQRHGVRKVRRQRWIGVPMPGLEVPGLPRGHRYRACRRGHLC